MEAKNEWETAKVDEILELLSEFHEQIMEYILVSLGFLPGDKVSLVQFNLLDLTPAPEHQIQIARLKSGSE
jgi:hypothetical protein